MKGFVAFSTAGYYFPHGVPGGEIGTISAVRFVTPDELLLRYGDKRQRRRVRRKFKLGRP